jgi:hypothetical protein
MPSSEAERLLGYMDKVKALEEESADVYNITLWAQGVTFCSIRFSAGDMADEDAALLGDAFETLTPIDDHVASLILWCNDEEPPSFFPKEMLITRVEAAAIKITEDDMVYKAYVNSSNILVETEPIFEEDLKAIVEGRV